jgi:hypothetical protein
MKISRTNGDITYPTEEIMASTLRLISEQPSDWVIRVTDYLPDEERSMEGTLAAFDQDVLTLAETDEEAQHTGFSRDINLNDIIEIEVL